MKYHPHLQIVAEEEGVVAEGFVLFPMPEVVPPPIPGSDVGGVGFRLVFDCDGSHIVVGDSEDFLG